MSLCGKLKKEVYFKAQKRSCFEIEDTTIWFHFLDVDLSLKMCAKVNNGKRLVRCLRKDNRVLFYTMLDLVLTLGAVS